MWITFSFFDGLNTSNKGAITDVTAPPIGLNSAGCFVELLFVGNALYPLTFKLFGAALYWPFAVGLFIPVESNCIFLDGLYSPLL